MWLQEGKVTRNVKRMRRALRENDGLREGILRQGSQKLVEVDDMKSDRQNPDREN